MSPSLPVRHHHIEWSNRGSHNANQSSATVMTHEKSRPPDIAASFAGGCRIISLYVAHQDSIGARSKYYDSKDTGSWWSGSSIPFVADRKFGPGGALPVVPPHHSEWQRLFLRFTKDEKFVTCSRFMTESCQDGRFFEPLPQHILLPRTCQLPDLWA